MGRVCIPSRGPGDWRARLADPERHWRAGFSAMAAARAWEAGFPPEVAALCGEAAELQLAVVEHEVPMPGRGKPSQCDVFALVHAGGRDMAIAVEAKVSEPFGPTVREWLGPAPSANRQERLAGLRALMDLPDTEGLRYQLLHRTAAAVLEARRFRRPVAAMIVQSFSPDRAWLPDFAAFAARLGLSIGAGEAAERSLPCGTVLRQGWACGDPAFLASLPGGAT